MSFIQFKLYMGSKFLWEECVIKLDEIGFAPIRLQKKKKKKKREEDMNRNNNLFLFNLSLPILEINLTQPSWTRTRPAHQASIINFIFLLANFQCIYTKIILDFLHCWWKFVHFSNINLLLLSLFVYAQLFKISII